jgi:hypothetical protein
MPFKALAIALALVAALGCQSIAVRDPLTSRPSAMNRTVTGRLEFWHELSRRPCVSNDEAFHGLLLYLDRDDPRTSYTERLGALRQRRMLPAGFSEPGDYAVSRGTLAVALAQLLGIKGGLTMHLIGPNPRYAIRALVHQDVFPDSSVNQTFSGAEFVGVMGRLEDVQRSADPSESFFAEGFRSPVPLKTAETPKPEKALLLMQLPSSANITASPATSQSPASTRSLIPENLNIIIKRVEGDVQVRASEDQPWVPARQWMRLPVRGEIQTGPKSVVHFLIPPNRAYLLDRLGTTKLLDAEFDGKTLRTQLEMAYGRISQVLEPGAGRPPSSDAGPIPVIEESGMRNQSEIQTNHTALAVRGTRVTIYDQLPFTAEGVIVRGEAYFLTAKRQFVRFGGTGKAVIASGSNSAAERALSQATASPSAALAVNNADALEARLAISRGGFVTGDVVVGNSSISDADLVRSLFGRLNFVLRWDGGPERRLADLNLFVSEPRLAAVANPPFVLSLDPTSSLGITARQAYPRVTANGGRIGLNHVGPEGLEIASWVSDFPKGQYTARAYNFVPANVLENGNLLPNRGSDPTTFRIDVFLDGNHIATKGGTVGFGDLSNSLLINIPPTANARVRKRR